MPNLFISCCRVDPSGRATVIKGIIVGMLGLIGVIAAAVIAAHNRVGTPSPAAFGATNPSRVQVVDLSSPTLTEPPGATLTPSPIRLTPTPTPDPLQAALDVARAFSGTNADWQALYPDGFIHAFDDGVPMALVPAGCFLMGSFAGEVYEQPVREQCFDTPFWIDQTEVIRTDFERLDGRKAAANGFDGDQRPVENITWFEARDFCVLRGARLPAEREWEYAARGPSNWDYPWGDTWDASYAVWNRGNSDGTADVGSIPAGRSWVGAFDLSGNVWEWTSSQYLSYDSTEDPEEDTGNRVNVLRVLRGGSWSNNEADVLRAAQRGGNFPDVWNEGDGFRCARST